LTGGELGGLAGGLVEFLQGRAAARLLTFLHVMEVLLGTFMSMVVPVIVNVILGSGAVIVSVADEMPGGQYSRSHRMLLSDAAQAASRYSSIDGEKGLKN
jgi:hypothetical protein